MRLWSSVIMLFGLRKQHLALKMIHLPLLRRAELHLRACKVQRETTKYGCDYSEDSVPSGSSCPVVGHWCSPAKSQDTQTAHCHTHRNEPSCITAAVGNLLLWHLNKKLKFFSLLPGNSILKGKCSFIHSLWVKGQGQSTLSEVQHSGDRWRECQR